jgi:hypothetical protein
LGEVLNLDVKAFAVPRAGWAKAFEQFGIPKGHTGAAEEMFEAVNAGWMDLGVEGTEHVAGTMSARDVFAAAQKAVTAWTATFTPMKIEIEYEGSCLGATGGTGRLIVRDALAKGRSVVVLVGRRKLVSFARRLTHSGKRTVPNGSLGRWTRLQGSRWSITHSLDVRLADREKRAVHTLTESNYLLGVADETRLGALRFRWLGDETFQSPTRVGVPPLIELGRLLQITTRFTGASSSMCWSLTSMITCAITASYGQAKPDARSYEINRMASAFEHAELERSLAL